MSPARPAQTHRESEVPINESNGALYALCAPKTWTWTQKLFKSYEICGGEGGK